MPLYDLAICVKDEMDLEKVRNKNLIYLTFRRKPLVFNHMDEF